jgi:hypothetical protein
MGQGIPVLLGELEGNVLAVVVLLIQDAFQLQVYAFVLLAGQPQGREAQRAETTQDTQLSGPAEEAQERSEHQSIKSYNAHTVIGLNSYT